MALINRNNFPPGGWQYEQKDSSGKIIKSSWSNTMSPFADFVKEVLSIRTANGLAGATTDEAAADVDNFQCQRLGNDPRYCHAEKKTPLPSRIFKAPVAAVKGLVEAAAKEIGKLDEGRKILQEWLGEGAMPVSQDEAQKRANQCIGCPLNRAGVSATAALAEVVKRHVESKQSENLTVEGEDKLGVCTGCGCYLPLKVHVPSQYLTLNNETKTAIEQAVPDCWQLKSPL